MATSYSGFTTLDSIKQLNLRAQRQKLFSNVQAVEPAQSLISLLAKNRRLPLGNEKAKSEMLVAPILSEIWSLNEDWCTLFSGYILDVDKEKGLTGRCDFLFSAIDSPEVQAPLFAVVEAKNDNVDDAIAQCAAQMLAARMFNERENRPDNTIYGASTTGYEWLFMRLDGFVVNVDKELYQLAALPELLGVLQHILNFSKTLSLHQPAS